MSPLILFFYFLSNFLFLACSWLLFWQIFLVPEVRPPPPTGASQRAPWTMARRREDQLFFSRACKMLKLVSKKYKKNHSFLRDHETEDFTPQTLHTYYFFEANSCQFLPFLPIFCFVGIWGIEASSFKPDQSLLLASSGDFLTHILWYI